MSRSRTSVALFRNNNQDEARLYYFSLLSFFLAQVFQLRSPPSREHSTFFVVSVINIPIHFVARSRANIRRPRRARLWKSKSHPQIRGRVICHLSLLYTARLPSF